MSVIVKSFHPKSYLELGRRSGWATAFHYVLIICVMSCLYAGATTMALVSFVHQVTPELLTRAPVINIKNGMVSSPVQQPYVVKFEGGEFILDTTQDVRDHLEDAPAVVIVGKSSILTKKPSGEIREQPFNKDVNLDFDSARLNEWIGVAQTWIFPVCAFVVLFWQGLWKLIQVLLVAGIVTGAVGGRPGFGTVLKMTVHALLPAMVFGFAVYCVWIATSFEVPMAWVGFYALLGGLPLVAAREQQAREQMLQRADFVPPQDLP